MEINLLEEEPVKIPVVDSVKRDIDPVIPGQAIAILTYKLYDQPRSFRSGAEKCFGLMKIRGVYSNVEDATKKSKELLDVMDRGKKECTLMAGVGQWFPITENKSVVSEKQEFSDSTEGRNAVSSTALYRDVEREKEAERKRLEADMIDREDKLRSNKDYTDDVESIEFYCMKRNTDLELTKQIDKLKASLKIYSDKRTKLREIIKHLDELKPEHKDNWLERFNEERSKTGVPQFIPRRDEFDDLNRELAEIPLTKKSIQKLNSELHGLKSSVTDGNSVRNIVKPE